MGGLVFLSSSAGAQIFHKQKKKVNKSTAADNTAEPDKIRSDHDRPSSEETATPIATDPPAAPRPTW